MLGEKRTPFAVAALLLLCIGGAGAQPTDAPATERTSQLAEWESLEYGMFIHYSMNTFSGIEIDAGATPAATYAPSALDVSQWIRVAKEAGMKYAVLTAKHTAGFCLWESEGYDCDVAKSGDKTDVVGEFMRACKKEGIKPGIYYCILDGHNEEGIKWGAAVGSDHFELIAFSPAAARTLLSGQAPLPRLRSDDEQRFQGRHGGEHGRLAERPDQR